MKVKPLTIEERAATGFTHRLDFSYRDIATGIANNTSTTWSAGYLPAVASGDVVRAVELHLNPALSDASDTAFNTCTLSFGDTTTATRFISASETNVNGTEVLTVTPGTNTNTIYTAAGQLMLTLNSMASKSLSNIDGGRGYILLDIDRSDADARVAAPPFGAGNT